MINVTATDFATDPRFEAIMNRPENRDPDDFSANWNFVEADCIMEMSMPSVMFDDVVDAFFEVAS